jgi:DNA adenine methylase
MAGKFNVPYCPPGHRTVPEELLLAASARLKTAILVHGDFEKTIADAGTGDFVYLDPPFAVAHRRVFSEYGPRLFQASDLSRLDGCLSTMNNRGAKFVVSYADCAEARKVLSRWNVRRVRTKRNIAGFTGDRRASFELMATNLPT